MLGFDALGRQALSELPRSAVSVSLAATYGSFSLSGPAIAFKVVEVVAAGGFVLNGISASFKVSLAPSTGAVSLTGRSTVFSAAMPAAGATYALAGFGASFSIVAHSDIDGCRRSEEVERDEPVELPSIRDSLERARRRANGEDDPTSARAGGRSQADRPVDPAMRAASAHALAMALHGLLQPRRADQQPSEEDFARVAQERQLAALRDDEAAIAALLIAA